MLECVYGHLVNDAKTIIQEFPQSDVRHVQLIRRNANAATHKLLAKMALIIGRDGMWNDVFPEFINDIVSED